MIEAAHHLRPQLRVAIAASDEKRRTALAGLVAQMGGVIVVSLEDAELVLMDGTVAAREGVAVLAVGGDQEDVAGLLPAGATVEQVEAALRAVAVGLRVRTEQSGFEAESATWPSQLLTPREIEVLSALAKGQSNKEIARALAISLHTVKFHVEAIFRKLGVRTRAEAVARGLVRVDL